MQPCTFNFTGTSNEVINPTAMPHGGQPLLANQIVQLISGLITVSASTVITIQDTTGLVLDVQQATSSFPVEYNGPGTSPAFAPATPGAGIVVNSSNSVIVTGRFQWTIKGSP